MANVIIKRSVAATNIDSYNRSAVATENLDNGSVFALKEKDETNELLWKVAAPTANAKGLWMATSPEVIYVDKAHGGSADPRAVRRYFCRLPDRTRGNHQTRRNHQACGDHRSRRDHSSR